MFLLYIGQPQGDPDMKTMEVFKQFIFATMFFVTCLTVHWNFVGSTQHKLSLQQGQHQQQYQQQQRVEIEVMEEKLALSESNKTAQL
jgi:hypothetical protein